MTAAELAILVRNCGANRQSGKAGLAFPEVRQPQEKSQARLRHKSQKRSLPINGRREIC